MIALLSLHSDEILYFGAYKIFVTHLSRDSCCYIRAYTNTVQTRPSRPDNISPLILYTTLYFAQTLVPQLTDIFNLSLSSSIIPDQWEIHKMQPIPKLKDKSNVAHFRPIISLLCSISKVLETIICSHVISFIRPLISKCQFGFMQNRSCLTQLLTSYAEVLDAIDQGSCTDIVFLDMKKLKAFGYVPHNELLLKLWQYGICGLLWCWFRSYLQHCLHYAEIDDTSSSMLPVLSGVRQGSILGQLLFIIFINDLPLNIHLITISNCRRY